MKEIKLGNKKYLYKSGKYYEVYNSRRRQLRKDELRAEIEKSVEDADRREKIFRDFELLDN